MKICITCSSGGHYQEALRATKLLDGQKYYVTFWTPHLAQEAMRKRVYFVPHPGRSLLRLIRNGIECYRILRQERPDIIISTGADVTVPTCILGKLLGATLVYIESGGNIWTPSLTGRILHPFAALFIVQWKPLLKRFRKAVYGGPLF